MLYFPLVAFLASVAPLCGAIEPVPQASDIVTIVNRDSPKVCALLCEDTGDTVGYLAGGTI
jgi:hypothetical protein